MSMIAMFFTAILGGNLLITQFLDISLLQSMKKPSIAIFIGVAMTVITLITGLIFYPIYVWILVPNALTYMSFLIIVILIAFLTEISQSILKTYAPKLEDAYGFYVPLISTNVIIAYVVLLLTQTTFAFLPWIITLLALPLGVMLSMLMILVYMERLEKVNRTPLPFKGLAITLILLSLIGMVLVGFGG